MINHVSSDVPAIVRELTGGRGADVVVDSVGEETWQKSQRALRRGGRFVTCGATTGPHISLDMRRLFWHQWSLLGSTLGNRREYAEIVRLAHEGRLWPVIDRSVPLSESTERARAASSGRTDRQTCDRGGLVNELWERLRAGAQQIGSVVPALLGAAVILADRVLSGPAGAALGRRCPQTARLQSGRGRRWARRGRGPHRIAPRSGSRARQARLLARHARGDSPGEHGAWPREHQPDVRHHARLHPDAHRRHRHHSVGHDRRRVRARRHSRIRGHGGRACRRSPRWPRARSS